ncbi:ubiquitin-like autophagy protein Apg12-domain-containing protein, partial [Mycena albidolilacea]
VGNTPVLKQNLFRLAATLPFQSVVSNLKKKLGMKAGDPLFTYINSTFAPAPDEVLGNLYSVRLSMSNTIEVRIIRTSGSLSISFKVVWNTSRWEAGAHYPLQV